MGIASLVAWLRPLAYRHKNYARTGRDLVMRAPKTKNQYLAIERQIEKWDPKPFQLINI